MIYLKKLFHARISIAVATVAFTSSLSFGALPSTYTIVPAGHISAESPAYDDSTLQRLIGYARNGRSGRPLPVVVDERYHRALQMISSDLNTKTGISILKEIKVAADIYQVDPVAVLGAIIAEHTFNVDGTDDVQTFIVQTASWSASWSLTFQMNNVPLSEVVNQPEFDSCRQTPNQYEYWICIQDNYNDRAPGHVGQIVRDRFGAPDASFRMTFFNPVHAGLTYGLGQLDPLRALMVADYVHSYSGFDMISINDPVKLYAAIIDPHSNVHYVAANVRMIVAAFAQHSGFDISRNPGLIATLYNLGHEWSRGDERKTLNKKSLKETGALAYPQENYYGWFVNDKVADLKALLDSVP